MLNLQAATEEQVETSQQHLELAYIGHHKLLVMPDQIKAAATNPNECIELGNGAFFLGV